MYLQLLTTHPPLGLGIDIDLPSVTEQTSERDETVNIFNQTVNFG